MSLLTFAQIGDGLAVFLAIVCFIIVVLRRPSVEQKLAMVYIVFSIVCCFGYWGLPHSNGNLQTLVLATKLKYLGSLILGLVFYLMVKYMRINLPVFMNVLLAAAIGFIIFLVIFFDSPDHFDASNPLSWGWFCRTWLFKGYSAEWSKGIPYLKKINNWGHVIYILLSVYYAVVLTYAYVQIMKTKIRNDVKNITTLYLVVMIPNLCYLLDKILGKALGSSAVLQTVPMGMVVSDFLFVYLICLTRFCDVIELASNAFFDTMETPAFVINSWYHLENINQTARMCFPEITDDLIGKDIYSIIPRNLCAITNVLLEATAESNGIEPVSDGMDNNLIYCNNIYYQPKVYKLQKGRKSEGYIIWLEDVTALKLESSDKIQSMRDKMILGFSSLAENHDFSTQGHLHRTAAYAKAIAQELFEQGMFKDEVNPKFIDTIEQVAPLHDIGKTYIDKDIFNKPARLDEDELKIMHQHTTLGAQFLEETLKDNRDSIYVRMAIDIALRHHEWWNGSGYPGNLAGTEIPLSARIMAVADTFDALVTIRPYKRSFTCEEAFDIIQNESGTHFEPAIVLCFLSIADKIKLIKAKVELQDMELEEIDE